MKLLGLHWHTVKAIDYQRMKREVIEPNRCRIRRLIMDEFALFKGHRYATVVIGAETQQVLWVGEGCSRAAVRPFFEWLGPEACADIEAVAMDLEVQHHCPRVAQLVAALSRRWWHNSLSAIHNVLTKAYFDRLGVPRLS